MTNLQLITVPTPAGDLTVAVEKENGVVRGTSFFGADDVRARLGDAAAGADVGGPRTPAVERVVDVFARYAAGEIRALDELAVAQPGGAFTQRVWAEMRKVHGVATYGEMAAAAGSPTAYQAAGNACATNVLPVVVPCHRILKADHSLGNYYFGLEVKHALLAHEGVLSDVRG
ncbi:MAG: methylated-DNA--[protein]-cysteine S-methyltransferase [Actinomycetales bacterium]